MRPPSEGLVYQPAYQLKSGRQKKCDTWWIQYNHRGKRYRENAKTTDEKEARDLLTVRPGNLKQAHVPPGRITYEDLEVRIRNDYKLNKRRSTARLENALTHLRDEFGNKKARDIEADDIIAYRSKRMDEGAAVATINRELSALRRMFNLAANTGKLGHKPYVSLLTEDNARKGFFERDQFDKVQANLSKDLRPLFAVAYFTGWRTGSELLPLQWHQVDFEDGWLRLEPGQAKNKLGRMFPMFGELREVLEAQRERTTFIERANGQIIPWVFHRNGRPIREFKRAWKTACTKAEIPEKLPHDFRRTAVRNLERARVSQSAAMGMTGHKTDAVCKRYAIVDETVLKESARKLDELHEAKRQLSAKAKS